MSEDGYVDIEIELEDWELKILKERSPFVMDLAGIPVKVTWTGEAILFTLASKEETDGEEVSEDQEG